MSTDFREQVEDLLRKDYTTDVYGNLKDIIMVDGDLDSRVNFVDAIDKLHEAEIERLERLSSALTSVEITLERQVSHGNGLDQWDTEDLLTIIQRAYITPKGGDK